MTARVRAVPENADVEKLRVWPLRALSVEGN